MRICFFLGLLPFPLAWSFLFRFIALCLGLLPGADKARGGRDCFSSRGVSTSGQAGGGEGAGVSLAGQDRQRAWATGLALRWQCLVIRPLHQGGHAVAAGVDEFYAESFMETPEGDRSYDDIFRPTQDIDLVVDGEDGANTGL